MPAVVFILIVIFGAITVWKGMSARHNERMASLAQNAGRGSQQGGPLMLTAAEVSKRDEVARELEQRVQHLETIVCSVDFELNAKLNRLASRQLQLDDVAMQALRAAPSSSTAAPKPKPRSLFTLEPGQELAGRFVVERALGHGGMGAVYLARDRQLSETVALKIMHGMALLDPAAEDRLRREASAARRISHPNVVKIHDVGEDQGHLFLSMEYVEGASLSEILSRHPKLPVDRVRAYVAAICEGLDAAHKQGVTHRDLKPANIIVGPDQEVKIIDFGLARIANLEGMTATGMLMGTPEYMAPEQIKGGTVDPRTDLYALGALTYHLLTGRPPFTGETPIAVSLAQATETPVAPTQLRPDLDPAWDTFIAKALSKPREQRFATALEMRDALPG